MTHSFRDVWRVARHIRIIYCYDNYYNINLLRNFLIIVKNCNSQGKNIAITCFLIYQSNKIQRLKLQDLYDNMKKVLSKR